MLLLALDFYEGKDVDGRDVKGLAFQPAKIASSHTVSVIDVASLYKSVTSSEHYFCLVSALSWTDVVGTPSIHQQGRWNFVNVVEFVGDVCSYDVSNEEPEESPVN